MLGRLRGLVRPLAPESRRGGADGIGRALAVHALVVRGALPLAQAQHGDALADVAPNPPWGGDPDAGGVSGGEAQQRHDGLAPEVGPLARGLHRDGVGGSLLVGPDGHPVDAPGDAHELTAPLLLDELGVGDAELLRLDGGDEPEVVHVRVYVVDNCHGRSISHVSYF